MTAVLATFTRKTEADAAARRARGEPGVDVRVGDPGDGLDALALGQRAEMDDAVGALSPGIASGPQARGAVLWGAVGAVVGVLVVLPLAFLVDAGDWPRAQIAIFVAMVGAFAGGTVGFVLGAGRQTVKEGETTPEDPTAVVRVDCAPERSEDVRRLLVDAGARSARVIDRPVSRPPTSDVEAPRPLGERTGERLGEGTDYDAGFGSDVR